MLPNALDINFKIILLNGREGDRKRGDILNVVDNENKDGRINVNLLFKPGHYDLLYAQNELECFQQADLKNAAPSVEEIKRRLTELEQLAIEKSPLVFNEKLQAWQKDLSNCLERAADNNSKETINDLGIKFLTNNYFQPILSAHVKNNNNSKQQPNIDQSNKLQRDLLQEYKHDLEEIKDKNSANINAIKRRLIDYIGTEEYLNDKVKGKCEGKINKYINKLVDLTEKYSKEELLPIYQELQTHLNALPQDKQNELSSIKDFVNETIVQIEGVDRVKDDSNSTSGHP